MFEIIHKGIQWTTIILYLVVMPLLLYIEYNSNEAFADSIVCEENKSISFDITINESYITEKKDCSFINEMSQKGNRIVYGVVIYMCLLMAYKYREEIKEAFNKG